jgi:dihydroflavonol-4-reductase
MPETTSLVAGATGFIGSHVARALVARGDHVRVTVRQQSNMVALEGLDVEFAEADVTDAAAVAKAMRGVDRVFHVAGVTNLKLGEDALFRANVEGTRVVAEAALRAGVQRFVHTSSVAAVGPAPRGSTADEDQRFPTDAARVPYVASKREAEMTALRFAARGLPVVVVNPAHVFGRGDFLLSSTDVVRRFLLRRIPAYVDGCINVVHVADVAAGHLLADERGEIGERYILGDRNYSWERLFADLGRFSGVEPPAVRLPAPVALALAETGKALPGFKAPVDVNEIRGASAWWAFRSTKARTRLGWTTRPHEETVEETVEWWRERLGDRLPPRGRIVRQPIPLRLGGFALRRANDITSRLTG